MIASILIGALALTALVAWGVVAFGKAQDTIRGNAEAAYRQGLDALKQRPGDPKLREQVLALGRQYALLTAQQPHIVPYDEVAIANDLNAATAGAMASHVAPSPGERVNAVQRSPLGRGTFQATVAGDVHAVLTGEAMFSVTVNENGTEICAVLLRADDGQNEHSVIFSNVLSEAPPPGLYYLGDMSAASFVGIYSITTAEGRSGSYAADKGRLEVMSSGPIYIQGTFELAGAGTHNLEFWAVEGQARVFGAFDAVRVADVFAVAFPAR